LQNHENRPIGSAPLPEVNATSSYFGGRGRGHRRGRRRGRGNGRNQKFLGPRHWYHAYRIAKHLVDLYQASLKEKDKRIETNFIGLTLWKLRNQTLVQMSITHLDIADFVTDPNEKLN
ncbi:hypothetical protein CFOL_v3_34554, partial [Cephalotus follicularis]